jgi:hypothetical protein
MMGRPKDPPKLKTVHSSSTDSFVLQHIRQYNMHDKYMKCPKCEGISDFSHWWDEITHYNAPVIVEHGRIFIDYRKAFQTAPLSIADDRETCTCGKCRRDVRMDEIELVDADEAEKEAA